MKKQRKLLPSRPSGGGYSIRVLAASENGWQREPECEPQKGWAGAWGGWRFSRGRLAPRLPRPPKDRAAVWCAPTTPGPGRGVRGLGAVFRGIGPSREDVPQTTLAAPRLLPTL